MPKFFLNYGGPDGAYSFDAAGAKDLDTACRKYYTGFVRSINTSISGIDVTVHTYGIHRALSLEIPEDASRDTRRKFNNAVAIAQQFCAEPYALLSHNCVTSVATTLHELDESIAPDDLFFPWSLDAHLNDYAGRYAENSTAARFIAQYQQQMEGESFSWFRTRTWAKERISSPTDIIKQSYGRVEGSGERTKSALLELGWVTENKRTGLLTPTLDAPADFREGLDNYNADFEKVENLKSLYAKEAGFFSLNTRRFFGDNPSYETAISRLEAQAKRNPEGASGKVLDMIKNAEATTDYRQQIQRGREAVVAAVEQVDDKVEEADIVLEDIPPSLSSP